MASTICQRPAVDCFKSSSQRPQVCCQPVPSTSIISCLSLNPQSPSLQRLSHEWDHASPDVHRLTFIRAILYLLPHLYGTHRHTNSLFPRQSPAIALYLLQHPPHLRTPPTTSLNQRRGKTKSLTLDHSTTGWVGTIPLTTHCLQQATSSQI